MEDIKYTIYENINDIEYDNNNYILFKNNSTFIIDCDFSLYCQSDINIEKEAIIKLCINKNKYYITHKILLDFFVFCIKIAEMMNYTQIILIKIFNTNLITSRKSIIFMKRQINKYLFSLYKTHYVDELFNQEDLSKELKKRFNNYSLDEQRENFEVGYMQKLSKAELAHYKVRKNIITRIIDSRNYNQRINLEKSYIENNKVNYLNVTCSLRGIKCKVSFHEKPLSSNFVIATPRADEFYFSFCLECFYNLFSALDYIYKHNDVEEYTVGNITIHHKPIDCYCYFTGIQEDLMYEVFINKLSFVLCEQSYNMLYGTVINSPTFLEVFPKKAEKCIERFNQQEEHTTLHTLQLLLNAERNSRYDDNLKFLNSKQTEIDRLTFDYEKQISRTCEDYERKISELKGNLINISAEKKALNNKLKNLDTYSAEYNKKMVNSFTKRIIYCSQRSKYGNLTVIGSSMKDIKNKPLEWFNITFINGNVCSFEYNSDGLLAVFELRRKNLEFCFAFCIKSIDIILEILDVALKTKRTPYNNNDDVRISVTEKYNGVHCCKCGDKEKRLYTFTFMNYKFSLCEHCAKQFQKQLTYAKKILEINKEYKTRDFIQQLLYY